MWDSVLDILKQKVQEGVEVRVMYDGTDEMFNLPHEYPNELKGMGIRCKVFHRFIRSFPHITTTVTTARSW